MPNYLAELLADAHARVEAARAERPLEKLRQDIDELAVSPPFAAALRRPGVAVIAEVKRASPSRGALAPQLDTAAQVTAYRDGGAAAVSVLTEPERFRGSLADLETAAALGVATLRKDFVVDAYQVWEARAVGASAVLLIVAALDPGTLEELTGVCDDAGVDALVEVHGVDEAHTALNAGARIVGVNARDLRTFDIDRDAFARVASTLPDGVLAVAESGIRGPQDVRAAGEQGADAVLVGESLVTASDPRRAVRELVAAGAPATTESR